MTDAEEIEHYRRRYGSPGMTAGQFAVLLPERLRSVYWRMKIEEFSGRKGSRLMSEGYENADDRELRTCDHIETHLCVIDGGDHDFRPYEYTSGGGRWQHTSLRCVWCHGVACGDFGDADPCMRIYHHRSNHRSRAGMEWPLGGDRPDRSWA